MAQRLTKLKLDEVSVVDVPANQRSKVVLRKRLETAPEEVTKMYTRVDGRVRGLEEKPISKALPTDLSFGQIQDKVRDALRATYPTKNKDGEPCYGPYVQDFYQDFCVYQDTSEEITYKVPYSFNSMGVVELGARVEVKISYVPVVSKVVELNNRVTALELANRISRIARTSV